MFYRTSAAPFIGFVEVADLVGAGGIGGGDAIASAKVDISDFHNSLISKQQSNAISNDSPLNPGIR